jgi:hypothetical protein
VIFIVSREPQKWTRGETCRLEHTSMTTFLKSVSDYFTTGTTGLTASEQIDDEEDEL